ncbi:MAG: molybdopterin cofactor-binding domain-containing protein [Vicinamibacterales bacterium]
MKVNSDLDELEVERYELFEGPRYRWDLERRDFLRIFGAVGGGLLVVASMPGAEAQESGRGGGSNRASAELNAWLHIDERGGITAFTGKTEIGQNIRTSLAQTVADELGVPVTSVKMLMADTDLTPYDAGTFGSQTTPRMAPQLARAAATARELLLADAATRWNVDRATLVVRDGRVKGPGTNSIGYAELAGRLNGTVATPRLTSADAWGERGKPVKKVDGRAFVTGKHEYTPDLRRPGMLFGRILRPEGYVGTLVSMDDTRARVMEGVKTIRDGEFVGVVAPNERLLKRAVAAIHAEWRVPSDEPSSETIYDHLRKTPATSGGGRGGSAPFTQGDPAQSRAQAAKTFDATYRIPYIAHVPLEPRAAVAEWAADGKLTVWCGTQRPFGIRSELASAFRIPEGRVRVIVPDTGSAYGGKHSGEHAIEAARLAKAAGKPVKVVWTRAEEFAWGYLRPAGVIDIKAGVDANGRLVAWEFDNWNSGGAAIRTPYDVPHQRIQFHPSASPLRQGSYRGLAATANHYAREMHIDAIARALGVDPVEFRLNHLKDERLRAVLSATAERVGWSRTGARMHSPSSPSLGIACGTEKGSYVATAAVVSKSATGFVVDKLVVAFECGAVVNPDGVRNQVEGAVVQGLGGALFEAIEFRNGALVNGTMQAYRVPRFKDVPAIELIILDRKDLPSAGAGETPIVCVAPAIGSAVRAFGKVDTALPVRLV